VNPPAAEESLEVAGPAGLKAKATGPQAAAVLLAGACTAGLAWMFWTHDQRSEANHREVSEKLTEVVYVLSLSPEERARLRIDMPPSLRRQNKRDRDRD
jgi:uncharacterized protein HemX